ncbi:unnamed protein product [Thelazia callipaeda]|uniref:Uncharacterized protein n=1 Tax=Thelazia callipaeda TaxID=103827 RepID=A0A0N5CKC8_THECL|nr:unnamed protein product [Thelazia callipaeda]
MAHNRYVRYDGNNNIEDGKGIILYNEQAASFPLVQQLWHTSQPFIPYHCTPPPLKYSPFPPHLIYRSNGIVNQSQNHKSVKLRRQGNIHFWCGGIAQLLWTVIAIVILGLFAILILALIAV